MADKKSKMSDRVNALKGEFDKIVWASREDVTKQTTAVIAVSIVVAVIIIVIDAVVNKGVGILVNL